MRSEGIRHSLEQLKNFGVNTIIFSGDEVIGYKHLVDDDPKTPKIKGAASLFSEIGLTYGTVEFGKQKGDVEMTPPPPLPTPHVCIRYWAPRWSRRRFQATCSGSCWLPVSAISACSMFVCSPMSVSR
ncbi:MAG: hypothetical protein QM758_29425 [Armatimonas sp.]